MISLLWPKETGCRVFRLPEQLAGWYPASSTAVHRAALKWAYLILIMTSWQHSLPLWTIRAFLNSQLQLISQLDYLVF